MSAGKAAAIGCGGAFGAVLGCCAGLVVVAAIIILILAKGYQQVEHIDQARPTSKAR